LETASTVDAFRGLLLRLLETACDLRTEDFEAFASLLSHQPGSRLGEAELATLQDAAARALVSLGGVPVGRTFQLTPYHVPIATPTPVASEERSRVADSIGLESVVHDKGEQQCG
jgi:hypothetical protein